MHDTQKLHNNVLLQCDLGQPGLGFGAVRIVAHGTPKQQLRTHRWDLLAEALLHQVSHGLYKERVVVWSGASSHTLRAGSRPHLEGVLDVELVKRLNVLVDEGDRHQQEVLVAPLAQDCRHAHT